MSKAFTRESDSEDDEILSPLPSSSLPPGVKNYLTPAGAARFREELARLVHTLRPGAAASPDRARELAAIDHRIAGLRQSLQSAEIVQPPANPDPVARFGATVTVRDRSGAVSKYRIVGVDEMDVDRGWVSWRSPVARALLNKRPGDRIRFSVPEGERHLEIIDIKYDEA